MTGSLFEELRPHLLRVAYAHTGSASDAEDIVQEAWLRLERRGSAGIGDLRSWLTTVVTRIAIDHLTSAAARRESYIGPWLPEPATRTGDPGVLLPLLDPDVALRHDGGGDVRASRSVIIGAARVAHVLSVLGRRFPDRQESIVLVNGDPGLLVRHEAQTSVVSLTVDDDRIIRIDIVSNPNKLSP